jgi:hypothetical protein
MAVKNQRLLVPRAKKTSIVLHNDGCITQCTQLLGSFLTPVQTI